MPSLWFTTKLKHRMIKQISPDKGMNFRSTTASFTVSAEPWALLSCASLPTDSACYDVSVRRLNALLQASFPQSLAALQLPLANSCCTLNKYRSSPIRDLHPISSRPCRAYTSAFTATAALANWLISCNFKSFSFRMLYALKPAAREAQSYVCKNKMKMIYEIYKQLFIHHQLVV